jgi:hypothetical protein
MPGFSGLFLRSVSKPAAQCRKEPTMRHLTLMLAVLLAACATPQERARQKQAEMEQMMVIYGPACGRLGYPVNSDQWRSCILNLSLKDEVRYSYPYYGSYWGHGGYWGPYW